MKKINKVNTKKVTALLVMTLKDIVLHDTTLTMDKVIMHIENEYDVKLTKTAVKAALAYNKKLV